MISNKFQLNMFSLKEIDGLSIVKFAENKNNQIRETKEFNNVSILISSISRKLRWPQSKNPFAKHRSNSREWEDLLLSIMIELS